MSDTSQFVILLLFPNIVTVSDYRFINSTYQQILPEQIWAPSFRFPPPPPAREDAAVQCSERERSPGRLALT